MVAAGLVVNEGTGFKHIATSHDPRASAEALVQFAKGVLAHSRLVMMPNTKRPVTVGIRARDGGYWLALIPI